MSNIKNWWKKLDAAKRLLFVNMYFGSDDVANLTDSQMEKIYEFEVQMPMLKEVKDGIISDSNLILAIEHYKTLINLLKPHGERYGLVYRDASSIYYNLKEMQRLRKN